MNERTEERRCRACGAIFQLRPMDLDNPLGASDMKSLAPSLRAQERAVPETGPFSIRNGHEDTRHD